MPMQISDVKHRLKIGSTESEQSVEVEKKRKRKVKTFDYDRLLKKKDAPLRARKSYVTKPKRKSLGTSRSKKTSAKYRVNPRPDNHTPEQRLHDRRRAKLFSGQNKSFVQSNPRLNESSTQKEHQRNFSFSNSFTENKESSARRPTREEKKEEPRILTSKSTNELNPFHISQSSSDRDSRPDAPFFPQSVNGDLKEEEVYEDRPKQKTLKEQIVETLKAAKRHKATEKKLDAAKRKRKLLLKGRH